MKNRIFFALLILLCSGFFTRSSPGADKIRVGLSSISATSGSIWVAEEKGLFRKHDIDAEVIIVGGA